MTALQMNIIKPILIAFQISLMVFAQACSQKGTPYSWTLPPDFKAPTVPEDNPMTEEKVLLGRQLFYDTALSGNNSQSCASCHQQHRAFSENQTTSTGSTGESHRRNAATLTNAAYNSTLTWAHPELKLLERQILIPLFSENPVEMQASGNEHTILQRLESDARYPSLFSQAFPRQKQAINFDNIVKALASFVRSLTSFNSAFDRYAWYGDDKALNESQLRGLDLFMSERLECRHCHGGFNFSLSNVHENTSALAQEFHNTGLYNPEKSTVLDEGIYEFSGAEADRGRFRPPTLRNIEFTAPYMHDGSIDTLEDVIDFYAAGGRVITQGPLAGDGRLHPNKSIFLHGFVLNAQEKTDLIAFLKSLSDEEFIHNPKLSYPKPRTLTSK